MESRDGRFRIERAGDGFPYVDGRPVGLTAGQWWLLMASLAVAYGLLVLPLLAGFPLLRVVLFAVLPLAVLRLVAGSGWTALFRRPRAMDVLVAAGYALLYIVVTFAIGLVFAALMDVSVNPGVVGLAGADNEQRAAFFAMSIVQLFGEEVLAILPFLALLAWLTARGAGRKRAVVLALLIASVLFALAHLPTYGWNVAQVLVVLVPARIILFLPYVATKNILVSTLAHIFADWTLFAMAILLADLVQAGAGG